MVFPDRVDPGIGFIWDVVFPDRFDPGIGFIWDVVFPDRVIMRWRDPGMWCSRIVLIPGLGLSGMWCSRIVLL